LTLRSALFGVAAATGLVGAARAQTPPPDWTVDLGAIARTRPVHLGSPRYTNDLLPIVSASYGDRVAFSLDDGLTASLWRDGGWSAGPVVEYRQSYNDRVPRRAFAMDDAVEVGGFVKRRTPLGDIDLRVRKAVTGYGGWSGDLAFDTGAQVSARWKVGGQARLSWADSSFSREYFGLRRNTDRPMPLPRFGGNDFYSAGLELDAARAVGSRTALIATVSLDRILGDEWRSPLLRDRNVATFGLGVTYRLGRAAP